MSDNKEPLDWYRAADLVDLPAGRVKQADQLESAILEGLSHPGPALIEIITDADLI